MSSRAEHIAGSTLAGMGKRLGSVLRGEDMPITERSCEDSVSAPLATITSFLSLKCHRRNRLVSWGWQFLKGNSEVFTYPLIFPGPNNFFSLRACGEGTPESVLLTLTAALSLAQEKETWGKASHSTPGPWLRAVCLATQALKLPMDLL